ncbi:MAG: hypothetical protein R6U21_07290 [Thermoplasmatota archaeon]
MKRLQVFLKNNDAVSEEFTGLPALAMVMIGITLFLIILSSSYTSLENQTDQVEQIKQAEYISSQLLNPTAPFISSKGSFNLEGFQQNSGKKYVTLLQKSMNQISLNFTTKLSFQNSSFYFPNPPPTNHQNIIGYSTAITLDLNEVYTCPGMITIIMWER